jgi:hypothetical protein
MKYFLPVERAARKFWLAVVQAANKNAVANLWRANKALIDTAKDVSDYQRMEESKVEYLPESALKNPGRAQVEKLNQAMSVNEFLTSARCSRANDMAGSPDKRLNQTRKLLEETVKLSDLAHGLFWLTVVLGVFALIRYVNMVLDFYDHS